MKMTIDEAREKLGGTKVHAVAIQKGGTGKTTITSDLCYTLAKMGFKVLAIDSDPQASLSGLCNKQDETLGLQTLYELLLYSLKKRIPFTFDDVKKVWIEYDENGNNIKAPRYIAPKYRSVETESRPFGFDLIPASIDLANYDINLNKSAELGSSGGTALKYFVDLIKKNMDYDFIIIDTCPGLNMIAYNAICAGIDGTIIPINLEPMTIKGAQNLINTTTEIQELLWENQGCIHKGILGVIKNQYAPRLKIQQRFEGVVETFFPIPAFKTTIPSKTSCDTAHDLGRLYSEYDPKVGKKFEELVEEIIKEDIRRAPEAELIKVEKFGQEVWDAVNEKKGEINNE